MISSLMICRLMLNLKRGRDPMPPTINTISYFGGRTSMATVGSVRTQYRNYLYMGDLDQDLDIDSAEHEKERKELERTRRPRTTEWPARPEHIEMGRIGWNNFNKSQDF